jgi:hypothetical protein
MFGGRKRNRTERGNGNRIASRRACKLFGCDFKLAIVGCVRGGRWDGDDAVLCGFVAGRS